MSYLLIALGSALGGVARHWCTVAIGARMAAPTGALMPWGTIAVNIVGSLIIGIVMGMLEPSGRLSISVASRDYLVQFLAIGFLGGYTTFSSFSLQTMNLLREHQWWLAGANVAISVVACLIAVAVGFALTSALTR